MEGPAGINIVEDTMKNRNIQNSLKDKSIPAYTFKDYRLDAIKPIYLQRARRVTAVSKCCTSHIIIATLVISTISTIYALFLLLAPTCFGVIDIFKKLIPKHVGAK